MPVFGGSLSIQRFISLFKSGKYFTFELCFLPFKLLPLSFFFLNIAFPPFYLFFISGIHYIRCWGFSIYPLHLLTLLFKKSFYCSVLISGNIAQFHFPGLQFRWLFCHSVYLVIFYVFSY